MRAQDRSVRIRSRDDISGAIARHDVTQSPLSAAYDTGRRFLPTKTQLLIKFPGPAIYSPWSDARSMPAGILPPCSPDRFCAVDSQVAKYGGVLERRGHTEAGIDLCMLSGTRPTGLLCEMTHDDGTMMRLPACEEFAEKHGLKLINIEQLARSPPHGAHLITDTDLKESLHTDNLQAVARTCVLHTRVH